MDDAELFINPIRIDPETMTFSITDGTSGTWDLRDIQSIRVKAENARYHNKSVPFTHQIYPQGHGVNSATFAIFEPGAIVGMDITMKNGTHLAAFVHKKPVYSGTDQIRHLFKRSEMLAAALCQTQTV